MKKEELIEKLMALNSESDSSNIEENSLPSEPNEEILPQEENLPTENVDFQNNEDEQEPEIGFDNDDNDDNNQSYYDEPEADYVEEEPKQNSAADAARLILDKIRAQNRALRWNNIYKNSNVRRKMPNSIVRSARTNSKKSRKSANSSNNKSTPRTGVKTKLKPKNRKMKNPLTSTLLRYSLSLISTI